jgi:hypothetical protein
MEGICYHCRPHKPITMADEHKVYSGICVECHRESETLYYNRCVKCRKAYGMRKILENKKAAHD